MSEALKQSILATVDEIAKGHSALGIAPEPYELAEAWFIIERMERQFLAQREASNSPAE